MATKFNERFNSTLIIRLIKTTKEACDTNEELNSYLELFTPNATYVVDKLKKEGTTPKELCNYIETYPLRSLWLIRTFIAVVMAERENSEEYKAGNLGYIVNYIKTGSTGIMDEKDPLISEQEKKDFKAKEKELVENSDPWMLYIVINETLYSDLVCSAFGIEAAKK
jgi:hypothetical protein